MIVAHAAMVTLIAWTGDDERVVAARFSCRCWPAPCGHRLAEARSGSRRAALPGALRAAATGGGEATGTHPAYLVGRTTGLGLYVGPRDVGEAPQRRLAQRQPAHRLVGARLPGMHLASGQPYAVLVGP